MVFLPTRLRVSRPRLEKYSENWYELYPNDDPLDFTNRTVCDDVSKLYDEKVLALLDEVHQALIPEDFEEGEEEEWVASCSIRIRRAPLAAIIFGGSIWPLPWYYGPLRHPTRPGLSLASCRFIPTAISAGLPVLLLVSYAYMPSPLPRQVR